MLKKQINFEYYVDYVTKYSKIKLPEALFNNIENDVNKQIMLARFLINYLRSIAMNKNRPLIITFFGYISLLAALLGIVALIPGFLERFNFTVIQLPIFINSITRALLSLILLIASYGFLKLKRWGYWLMIIYDFFLVAYIAFYNKHLIASTNVIITIIQLIFILPTKKYFYESN